LKLTLQKVFEKDFLFYILMLLIESKSQFVTHGCLGWKKFIAHKDLFDVDNNLLPDGHLNLGCKVCTEE